MSPSQITTAPSTSLRAPEDAATPAAQPVRLRAPREARLDVFRGICLVMIFINHVPGNSYEAFTSRNFGFSDAAEGFVIMSGIAAGLAYSADFGFPLRLWHGLGRVWGRVWTLYLVQMTITLIALATVALIARVTGDGRILYANNMNWMWESPVNAFIGLPLLMLQFAYLNILPLYIVLLAASPLMFYLAHRAPGWLMAGSVAIWATVGMLRYSPPNWPGGGTWFFSPLSWQIIFVVGVLIGVSMKRGERLVPNRRWILWLAGAYVLFALVDSRLMVMSNWLAVVLRSAKEDLGIPWILVDFYKPMATLPRLLHIFALTYVIASVPLIARVCASWPLQPLAVLGRHSLPVFAFGSVMAIGLQGVFKAVSHGPLLEALLLGTGLALQFALAYAREHWPKPARTK